MLTKKQFLTETRGSVAVEFAVVSMLAMMVILFILNAALIFYLNQALDVATSQAARQIVTGSAQAASLNSSGFRANLCALVPKTMDCGKLTINLYTVPKAAAPAGFYAYVNADVSGLRMPDLGNATGQFSLGGRGDYQYLQVIYPITFPPAAILSWLSGGATYQGAPVYLAVSTAAFRNEQF